MSTWTGNRNDITGAWLAARMRHAYSYRTVMYTPRQEMRVERGLLYRVSRAGADRHGQL